jgi:EAL domain-containing protein (putative c-di-GMP-specific phosphodiesterase class I)
MYSAKSAGRNTAAVFAPSLVIRGRDRLELDSALHKALERGEIELHYQPKVDVLRARVVGAEALMRWRHGGRIVQPGEFIPLAEESGLIEPLSYWALDEAMRQAAAWRADIGFSGAIAVNLPARVLERAELVDRIRACVDGHAVSFEALIVEITETGLMKDMDRALAVLERLRAIGVRLSIDDFGTGYSSLAYLTSLPISELKIDGSFVRGLGVAARSAAVATAIIALGRSLGLEVVAEGVETLAQLRQLRAQGCEVMQGYLFSPAMVPQAFAHWVQRGPGEGQAPWVLERVA